MLKYVTFWIPQNVLSYELMDTYKRLFNLYVRPYKWRMILSIFAGQGTALFSALISVTAYVTINGLQNKNEVIIDKIPMMPWDGQIRFPTYWIPFIIVGVFLGRSLFEFISQYQMAMVGLRIVRKIRDDLYRHLVYLSHDYYSKGRTGDFLSRIMNDVGSIQGALTNVIEDIFKQPFIILYSIPFIFIWGGKYALCAVLVFPLAAIPIIFLGGSLRRNTKKMQERSADITAFIGETLLGFQIVKAFNREETEIQRFERINKNVFDFFKKTIRVTIIQRPLIEVMGAIGVATAVWFALQHLPADRFGAFVGSLFILYDPLKKISKVNSTIQQSVAAGSRIFEVLDSSPSIQDKPSAVDFRDAVREIAFKHVSFSYDGEKQVLQDISFSVQRGEVIALVGASGSGKSTLVNLLLRFYDPTTGAICINGRDLREMKIKSVRDLIGIVTQDTILFNETVRENIAFGNPSASLENIREAAHVAFADRFIQELPQGYETNLGERGLKLSGGQRQRIAIARAILKDPPIIILDEATSHLDTESEREVQNALENAMRGRTVFVIAHRLSTVQKADRIFVMDQGKIIQVGTNDELLQSGGAYKKLYDLQFNI